jgi:hypothetical protein
MRSFECLLICWHVFVYGSARNGIIERPSECHRKTIILRRRTISGATADVIGISEPMHQRDAFSMDILAQYDADKSSSSRRWSLKVLILVIFKTIMLTLGAIIAYDMFHYIKKIGNAQEEDMRLFSVYLFRKLWYIMEYVISIINKQYILNDNRKQNMEVRVNAIKESSTFVLPQSNYLQLIFEEMSKSSNPGVTCFESRVYCQEQSTSRSLAVACIQKVCQQYLQAMCRTPTVQRCESSIFNYYNLEIFENCQGEHDIVCINKLVLLCGEQLTEKCYPELYRGECGREIMKQTLDSVSALYIDG